MPALGADMEQGTLLEWRVAPGDEVARGDIVAVVDTDKSDIEVEVFESGVVDELLVAEGTEVAVGTPLARIRPNGEAEVEGGGGPSGASPAGPTPPTSPRREPAAGPVATPTAAHAPPRVHSPLVRRHADELGVDLTRLVGTGHGGAVTRADVDRAAAIGPRPRWSPYARRRAAELGVDASSVRAATPGAPVGVADVELAASTLPDRRRAGSGSGSGSEGEPAADVPPRRGRQASIRRSVAELMARSKREIPHYYLSSTIDLAASTAWLATVNAERPVTERILPAALLLKATALAARRSPEINGHWIDGELRSADRVDLGVAVALRGGGLVAPVVVRADELTIDELMAALRDLVTRARAGSLRSSEMAMPTLTVTNLGDQGVDSVFGVIYPPQVALVGFGTVVERPWAVDGMIGVHPVVTATLAADHRASDGHRGARFLAAVGRLLADPGHL